MRGAWFLMLLWASFADAGIEIRHDPITCVPLDSHARVSARGVPAGQVSAAELQFRVDSTSDWYSTRLSYTGVEWSGLLPRPRRPLQRFEYRIAMTSAPSETGAAAETAESAPYTVIVSDASVGCRTPVQLTTGSPIVVTVPAGAPVVPPVPPGFSPIGILADQAQIRPAKASLTKWAILGGVVVAGAAVAAVAAKGSNEAVAPEDIPGFSFQGTNPNPGAVLSLSRSTLAVFVRMSREPRAALTFIWRLELRSGPGGQPCVVMNDLFRGAQRPLDLILSAPLNPGGCGESFSVTEGRLTIDVAGELVLDTTLGLPFRFEP